MEEKGEEEQRKLEQRELELGKDIERLEEELDKEQRTWEEARTQEKDIERRNNVRKMAPKGTKG